MIEFWRKSEFTKVNHIHWISGRFFVAFWFSLQRWVFFFFFFSLCIRFQCRFHIHIFFCSLLSSVTDDIRQWQSVRACVCARALSYSPHSHQCFYAWFAVCASSSRLYQSIFCQFRASDNIYDYQEDKFKRNQ